MNNYIILGINTESNRKRVKILKKYNQELNIVDLLINDFNELPNNLNLAGNSMVKLLPLCKSTDLFNLGLFEGPIFSSDIEFYSSFCTLVDTLSNWVDECVDNPIFVNSPETIKLLRSKKKMYEFFESNNIPHANTYSISNADYLLSLLEERALCIKPIAGLQSYGVSSIKKQNNVYIVDVLKHDIVTKTLGKRNSFSLNEIELKKFLEDSINNGCIFQDYLEFGSDYLGVSKIQYVFGKVYSNLIPESIKKIVELFPDLNIASVDIFYDEGTNRTSLISEINAFPGIENKTKQQIVRELKKSA